ncbi:MAG TPA: carboxypeptidase-like regulatory domain-containing protein, partial [Saprospiraceae bacterium]|nr:carboxypeptidase-like regulatory domain-containing protein [Saprospiraceae bacterium]
DKTTKQPLIGATVEVEGKSLGITTDETGQFVIESVPLGRHNLISQYLGYEPTIVEGIILNSTREAYVEISLAPGSVNLQDVIIMGSKNAFEAVNPLSVVSSRSFTAE